MKEGYTRAQRTELELALRKKGELKCPACGGTMTKQNVVAPDNVPYVRHRVWLLCADCKRSASLDQR